MYCAGLCCVRFCFCSVQYYGWDKNCLCISRFHHLLWAFRMNNTDVMNSICSSYFKNAMELKMNYKFERGDKKSWTHFIHQGHLTMAVFVNSIERYDAVFKNKNWPLPRTLFCVCHCVLASALASASSSPISLFRWPSDVS